MFTAGCKNANMSERQVESPSRQSTFSDAFSAFVGTGWAPFAAQVPDVLPAAAPAAQRRQAVSARIPASGWSIPAGGLKIRSNDTDYRFRPHSAFAHLTGLGTDREPDAVLVLEPTDAGHDATLYFKPRAPRDSEEFYADARYGEMWVGRRPSLDEMGALCGIRCAVDRRARASTCGKNADATAIRVLPVDRRRRSPRSSTRSVPAEEPPSPTSRRDQELAVVA